jgi:general secretion pathway protein H
MPATSVIGEHAARPSLNARSHARAFTLIEMMVVLAIVVLMSAAVPFALNRLLPARRASVAAERLVADIHWLQSQAAVTSTPARLAVLPSGYRLESAQRVRDVIWPGSTTVRLWAAGEDRDLPELTLYPDGTASAGRFELADSGRRATVVVSMLAGRARRTE